MMRPGPQRYLHPNAGDFFRLVGLASGHCVRSTARSSEERLTHARDGCIDLARRAGHAAWDPVARTSQHEPAPRHGVHAEAALSENRRERSNPRRRDLVEKMWAHGQARRGLTLKMDGL